MMNKLSFLAGVGAGYVLGARGGSGQLDQLKAQSAKALQSDAVQAKIAQAADTVKAKAPAPAHKIVDKAVGAVSGGSRPGTTQTGTGYGSGYTTPATTSMTAGSATDGRIDADYAGNPVGMPGMPAAGDKNL
ncbi:hypothetical protein [Arsenicicoccus dermatophilus]|uniref:hypothetical protein n=1 Tax=Arsenicicoccus dermatophilus TaxID=1076331 RepID=UPI001F4D1DB5|nr:hypothetical protein [Arsenicicoccus dermatophilus]MCH8611628.1 hypothetical protein [Arsenicicoccus dermatophilus]